MIKTTHKVKIVLYEFIKRTWDIPKHQYISTEVSKFLKSRVKVAQTQCFRGTRRTDLRYVAGLHHGAKSFQSRGCSQLALFPLGTAKITAVGQG